MTSTNGTLTVTQASLVVTGTNASRVYGDINPAFTGTIVGIKNGDNITATFASAATAASSVGAIQSWQRWLIPPVSSATTA